MLNDIKDVINKKGESYLMNFLNSPLFIYEKLDTFRIKIEKVNNKFYLYKKNGKIVNDFDMLFCSFYDTIHDDLLSKNGILHDGLSLIKDDIALYFSVYDYNDGIYQTIPYKNIPKYILTDAHYLSGKRNKIKFNIVELRELGKILQVPVISPIFYGYLNDSQQKAILDYYHKSKVPLSEMINRNFKESYSGEYLIKGVVLDNEKDIVYLKSKEFYNIYDSYLDNNFDGTNQNILLKYFCEWVIANQNHLIYIFSLDNKICILSALIKIFIEKTSFVIPKNLIDSRIKRKFNNNLYETYFSFYTKRYILKGESQIDALSVLLLNITNCEHYKYSDEYIKELLQKINNILKSYGKNI